MSTKVRQKFLRQSLILSNDWLAMLVKLILVMERGQTLDHGFGVTVY